MDGITAPREKFTHKQKKPGLSTGLSRKLYVSEACLTWQLSELPGQQFR